MSARKSWLLTLVLSLAAAESVDAEERVPWTTSRVRGSPEPPLPFRLENIDPELRFTEPVVITHVPGSGKLLVVEREGKIHTFENADGKRKPRLAIDIRNKNSRCDAAYGLAFDPAFEHNRRIYICYITGNKRPDGTRVSRFRATSIDPLVIDPDSEEILITWLSGGHNGGCLQFGPDGFLYISAGDAEAPSPPDKLTAGQDVSNLLSTIMRIDVDTDDASYRVPKDNPFVGKPDIRPEIWAYGFRNPWKMSFGPKDGALWVGDVGWEMWEMIFRVERGGNYGWSIVEGRQPIRPVQKPGPTPILPPTVEHDHTEARSITGGRVYRGERLAELRDEYVYADYETGIFWGVRHDGKEVTSKRELARAKIKPVSFGEGAKGEIFVLDYIAGGIYRIERSERQGDGDDFPTRLSETGIFADVEKHEPASGVVPYEIRSELWADGASAQRFVAIPGATKIGGDSRNFRFPEGTVFAKTLTLPEREGESARRVETQLLHHEDGEWRTYSYLWNEAGADAELVPRGGTAHDEWPFVSRTTCQLCHNFTMRGPIGFRADQLARWPEVDDELAALFERKPRENRRMRPLADPHDEMLPLESRARSYLHVNCSPCHRNNGGGAATIDVRSSRSLDRTFTIDERPKLGDFGIDSARIVSEGDANRSVITYRMAALGPSRMPLVSSRQVDTRGLALIRAWIDSLTDRAHESVDAEIAAAILPDGDAALDRLLSRTQKSLALVRALDEGRVSKARLDDLAEKVTVHSEPHVHELFRRFLPVDRQTKKRGEVVEAEAILALPSHPERGAQIFARGSAQTCQRCHRLGDLGKPFGPDLSQVGARLDRAKILESILEPAKTIEPKFASYLATTKTGAVHTGILLESDEKRVVVGTVDGRRVEVARKDLAVLAKQPGSSMPDLLFRDMSAQDLADLVAYLASRR